MLKRLIWSSFLGRSSQDRDYIKRLHVRTRKFDIASHYISSFFLHKTSQSKDTNMKFILSIIAALSISGWAAAQVGPCYNQ
jgi:hypothetical protein